MNKNSFIAVEGIDGSGKSTVIDMIRVYLLSMGFLNNNIITTAEPTDSKIGKSIRDLISNGIDNQELLYHLFIADRIHHIEKLIKPSVKNGNIVITDRYMLSSMVYQHNLIDRLRVDYQAMIKPDLTIYCDPKDEFKRIFETREDFDVFEKQDKLIAYKKIYEKLLPEMGKVFVLDTSVSIEKTKEDLIKFLDEEFNLINLATDDVFNRNKIFDLINSRGGNVDGVFIEILNEETGEFEETDNWLISKKKTVKILVGEVFIESGDSFMDNCEDVFSCVVPLNTDDITDYFIKNYKLGV